MKSLLLACLCVVAVCNATTIRVKLSVFSGVADPQWTLRDSDADAIVAVFDSLPVDTARPLPWYSLGYAGFTVAMGGASRVVYNDFATELLLLASGKESLPPAVIEHVRADIERLRAEKAAGMVYPLAPVSSESPNDNCTIPVIGSDSNTVYDLAHDCCGFFQTYCGDNNCYNYGNDIVSNTFAQPGRGSGQQWKSNTCDDMRAAAERDGLVWAGTTLPTSQPSTGHYVALLIWPQTNFHWIRFDSVPAGYWSHKPGGTPARNVDDDGELITDPSKSDFSPWTQFCGYMSTIPSKVHIK